MYVRKEESILLPLFTSEIGTEKSTFQAGPGGMSKALTSDTKFKMVPKHSVIKMNDVLMQYFIKSTII